MKSKITLSAYSSILTIVILIFMGVAILSCRAELAALITVGSIFLILIIATMLYAPLSISANPEFVSVNSLLLRHKIPVRRIVSVERFAPTMGAIRLFASGGFMGYWGIFREGDVGRYMAYYGKSSDCFMLKLDNGDKYLLGCADPDAMTEYISSLLHK